MLEPTLAEVQHMNVRTFNKQTSALALTVAAACVTALPAQAADRAASRQENIGVGTGLVVGALAGGPFGAIFGAAAGAWLGDRYHRQAATNSTLTTQLAESNAERGKLNASVMELEAHGEELTHRLELRTELETQVGFRTGDATLSAETSDELKKLAALASTLPETQVRVSGYADPRGTEEFNSKLSKERADAVAAVLKDAGLDASRLTVEAHGDTEAKAADGDVDGYAFDRRVVVRIEPTKTEAVAQRQ